MNKYQKTILSLSLVFSLLMLSPTQTKAQAVVPSFPACSNPQGTLKVSYENGIHGIVGNTSQFSGSDSVYIIDDISLIQCFCADDGQGIQTNWWKISSLTQDEIDSLKKLGWLFIPSGSVWGLDSSPYLAKNSDYDCNGVVNENNNSSSGQDSSTAAAAEPKTGSVLGLAATGNSSLIYSLLILGLASILLGKILRRGIRY